MNSKRILSQAIWESKILLSNGEQLLVAIGIPALVLMAMKFLPIGRIPGMETMDLAVAAMLTTALISTAFTAQAISTGFDRRGGVLRWIATTPLGLNGYLAGKVMALALIQLLQWIVLALLALALGWAPHVHLGGMLLTWILGSFTFTCLGLLLAGTLRTEAVLALANTIFLLFVAVGGVIIPVKDFAFGLAHVLWLLPSSALANLVRAGLGIGGYQAADVAVLVAWGVIAYLAVLRYFKWSSN